MGEAIGTTGKGVGVVNSAVLVRTSAPLGNLATIDTIEFP
jgi:adenylosuccinate synthase